MEQYVFVLVFGLFVTGVLMGVGANTLMNTRADVESLIDPRLNGTGGFEPYDPVYTESELKNIDAVNYFIDGMEIFTQITQELPNYKEDDFSTLKNRLELRSKNSDEYCDPWNTICQSLKNSFDFDVYGVDDLERISSNIDYLPENFYNDSEVKNSEDVYESLENGCNEYLQKNKPTFQIYANDFAQFCGVVGDTFVGTGFYTVTTSFTYGIRNELNEKMVFPAGNLFSFFLNHFFINKDTGFFLVPQDNTEHYLFKLNNTLSIKNVTHILIPKDNGKKDDFLLLSKAEDNKDKIASLILYNKTREGNTFVIPSFYMPQRCIDEDNNLDHGCTGESKDFLQNLIKVVNVPDFLFYYQTFPVGEEHSWVMQEGTSVGNQVVRSMLITAGFQAISNLNYLRKLGSANSAMKKSIQAGFQESGEKVTTSLTTNSFTRMMKTNSIDIADFNFFKKLYPNDDSLAMAHAYAKGLSSSSITREQAFELVNLRYSNQITWGRVGKTHLSNIDGDKFKNYLATRIKKGGNFDEIYNAFLAASEFPSTIFSKIPGLKINLINVGLDDTIAAFSRTNPDILKDDVYFQNLNKYFPKTTVRQAMNNYDKMNYVVDLYSKFPKLSEGLSGLVKNADNVFLNKEVQEESLKYLSAVLSDKKMYEKVLDVGKQANILDNDGALKIIASKISTPIRSAIKGLYGTAKTSFRYHLDVLYVALFMAKDATIEDYKKKLFTFETNDFYLSSPGQELGHTGSFQYDDKIPSIYIEKKDGLNVNFYLASPCLSNLELKLDEQELRVVPDTIIFKDYIIDLEDANNGLRDFIKQDFVEDSKTWIIEPFYDLDSFDAKYKTFMNPDLLSEGKNFFEKAVEFLKNFKPGVSEINSDESYNKGGAFYNYYPFNEGPLDICTNVTEDSMNCNMKLSLLYKSMLITFDNNELKNILTNFYKNAYNKCGSLCKKQLEYFEPFYKEFLLYFSIGKNVNPDLSIEQFLFMLLNPMYNSNENSYYFYYIGTAKDFEWDNKTFSKIPFSTFGLYLMDKYETDDVYTALETELKELRSKFDKTKFSDSCDDYTVCVSYYENLLINTFYPIYESFNRDGKVYPLSNDFHSLTNTTGSFFREAGINEQISLMDGSENNFRLTINEFLNKRTDFMFSSNIKNSLRNFNLDNNNVSNSWYRFLSLPYLAEHYRLLNENGEIFANYAINDDFVINASKYLLLFPILYDTRLNNEKIAKIGFDNMFPIDSENYIYQSPLYSFLNEKGYIDSFIENSLIDSDVINEQNIFLDQIEVNLDWKFYSRDYISEQKNLQGDWERDIDVLDKVELKGNSLNNIQNLFEELRKDSYESDLIDYYNNVYENCKDDDSCMNYLRIFFKNYKYIFDAFLIGVSQFKENNFGLSEFFFSLFIDEIETNNDFELPDTCYAYQYYDSKSCVFQDGKPSSILFSSTKKLKINLPSNFNFYDNDLKYQALSTFPLYLMYFTGKDNLSDAINEYYIYLNSDFNYIRGNYSKVFEYVYDTFKTKFNITNLDYQKDIFSKMVLEKSIYFFKTTSHSVIDYQRSRHDSITNAILNNINGFNFADFKRFYETVNPNFPFDDFKYFIESKQDLFPNSHGNHLIDSNRDLEWQNFYALDYFLNHPYILEFIENLYRGKTIFSSKESFFNLTMDYLVTLPLILDSRFDQNSLRDLSEDKIGDVNKWHLSPIFKKVVDYDEDDNTYYPIDIFIEPSHFGYDSLDDECDDSDKNNLLLCNVQNLLGYYYDLSDKFVDSFDSLNKKDLKSFDNNKYPERINIYSANFIGEIDWKKIFLSKKTEEENLNIYYPKINISSYLVNANVADNYYCYYNSNTYLINKKTRNLNSILIGSDIALSTAVYGFGPVAGRFLDMGVSMVFAGITPLLVNHQADELYWPNRG